MSFLTPLYVLGALAVAAPILFHLIQRRPRGETSFSSLMFLSPSPPRLTRRSRLDNLLLLLLRALALTLLAIAFARPFLRSALQLNYNSVARRTVVLLDTSASMQRDGIWPAAIAEVTQVCDESSSSDRLALVTFGRRAETIVGFDPGGLAQSDRLREIIERRLETIQPTWQETDLGSALVAACELLHDASSADESIESPAQIVLVTDCQEGSSIKALESFDWPQNIPVDVRVMSPAKKGNAFVQSMRTEDATLSDDIVVRVENVDVEGTDQFELQWTSDDGEVASKKLVQVPSGQSRAVRFPRESMTVRLVLTDDAEPFDNTRYFAKPAAMKRRVVTVGSPAGEESDPDSSGKGLFFFLERINLTNRFRDVAFSTSNNSVANLTGLMPVHTPLVVVGDHINKQQADVLHAYLNSGGNVLGVLSQHEYGNDAVQAWRALTGLETLVIAEAEVDDYALLSNIDFRHPFFVLFADSQFNDFTKIRFWSYRQLSASHEQPWRVLARFDNSAPAFVERGIGKGKLWLLAAGWHPEDSQLALSSKFVPLISSMFDASDSIRHTDDSYLVDIPIPLDFMSAVDSETNGTDANTVELLHPRGHLLPVENGAFIPDVPGVYTVTAAGESTSLAVNVSHRESKTTAMDVSQLEQRGVRIGRRESAIQIIDHQRQMKDVELESNQQIWRFLIFAALAVLGVETWLAGSKSQGSF